jgi:regulator of sigma E protease
MNTLLVVVGIAGMFLLLIAPHEAGHFAFAKLFKVRVIEFSIGAGTKLWSITRGGTVYAIRAFPVLGYVRMGGMEAGDFADPNGFHTKPAWQRLLILFGGPLANFIFAMLLVTAYDLTQLNDVPGKVVAILPGSPAAAAGMQPGDQLRTVDGQKITQPDQLQKVEDAAPNAAIQIGGVHANGKPFSYIVTPRCDATGKSCRMGVEARWSVLSPTDAVVSGVTFPFAAIHNLVYGMTQLFTGAVPGGILGPNGVTGPVGIADVAAQSAGAGLDTYLFYVALLSVALGFTNLLPLLALDGGRMVVVLIEVVRRRPFDRTAELNFQRYGLVALLALAALITFLDIQRIATGAFPVLR